MTIFLKRNLKYSLRAENILAFSVGLDRLIFSSQPSNFVVKAALITALIAPKGLSLKSLKLGLQKCRNKLLSLLIGAQLNSWNCVEYAKVDQ